MRAPLFIFGCPRSGTTFLSSLLEASSYGAPFETHFIPKYHRRLDRYGDLEQFDNFARLLGDLLRERPVLQRRLSLEPRELFDRLPTRDYATLAGAVCREMARKSRDTDSWGDKTPQYTLEVPRLLSLYPDAKSIFITRDGRDVALSLIEKPWGPANVYCCAQLWREYQEKQRDLLESLDPDSVLLLKYEELLDDCPGHIRRLYRFLGEPIAEEKVAELAAQARPGNYDKWRARLSARQKRMFESVAGTLLADAGYETVGEAATVSPLRRTGFIAQDRFKHWSNLFRMNVFETFAIRFLGHEPFAD